MNQHDQHKGHGAHGHDNHQEQGGDHQGPWAGMVVIRVTMP